MIREERYGIRRFRKDFPDDAACLEFIFTALHSRECSCGGQYSRVTGRRQYQCSRCRFQIAPTAGTIFHKSDTPLTLWFHAIHVFSNAKSGISAKEMERQLEVTYKTAWRMLYLIRKALDQGKDRLKGDVEMDSGFFGGHGNGGGNNEKLGKAMKKKTVVMAAVERRGRMRAEVVPDNTADTHYRFLEVNVSRKNTRLITDASNQYVNAAYGYKRESVIHRFKEYVKGDVHVNTIEGFWGHLKRSIRGTHKAISKQYFQSYLNGFVFHYNNRRSDKQRFSCLLDTLLHA